MHDTDSGVRTRCAKKNAYKIARSRSKELIERILAERNYAFEEIKKIFNSETREFLAESEDKLEVCDADRHDKECALHQKIKCKFLVHYHFVLHILTLSFSAISYV